MKNTRIMAIAIASLVTFSAVGAAHADDKARRNQARALWRAGTARFNVQKFDEAIKLYQQAYETAPELSGLLFNIAQAYRHMKNYEKARFFFVAYLRETPGADDREQVEERIAELEKLLEAQKESGEKPPSMQHASDKETTGDSVRPDLLATEVNAERWYHDRVGLGLGIGGLVSSGVSIGLFVSASGLEDEASRETDVDTKIRLREDARSRRVLGGIFGVVGVAGLVVGIIKLATPPDSRSQTTGSGLRFGPNSIAFSGSF